MTRTKDIVIALGLTVIYSFVAAALLYPLVYDLPIVGLLSPLIELAPACAFIAFRRISWKLCLPWLLILLYVGIWGAAAGTGSPLAFGEPTGPVSIGVQIENSFALLIFVAAMYYVPVVLIWACASMIFAKVRQRSGKTIP